MWAPQKLPEALDQLTASGFVAKALLARYDWETFGDGSIPIDTIFRGMDILHQGYKVLTH